jgi:ribosomal protein S18 acetylase RimI-like enzyme
VVLVLVSKWLLSNNGRASDNSRVKAAATRVKLKRAKEADTKIIAQILLQAFAEFESLYTKEAFAATVLQAPAVLTRIREGPVLVGSIGRRVVGTVSAVQRETGVYVRGMAVVPEARGLGIGRLFLGEVESFARACGANRLFLSTTPFLTSAILLYQKCGFRRTNQKPHELFGTPLFTMERILNA